jgi:16S rRNA C1402 (ribose-2'-O) methylase RsmI
MVATNVAGGVQIQTGPGSTILIAGLTVASLQADDFLF